MLFEDGKYSATVVDVYLYARGDEQRLTGAFELDINGKKLTHREWLEGRDGTLSEKTFARLRTCFPSWDGTIEMLEDGNCCRGVEVDVTIENERDKKNPDKYWTRSLYITAPGAGGGGGKTPEKLDSATLADRYANRFRAMAASVPVAAAPAAQRASPPPVKPPPAPAGEYTMNDCWGKLVELNPALARAAVEALWFKTMEQAVPGKDVGEMTPDDWGTVMQTIIGGPAEAATPAASMF